jgi:TrmH family RNA methyltransferase
MLTNKQIKLINSLHSKKGRTENQLFLVEGEKAISELVSSSLKIQFIVLNETIEQLKLYSNLTNSIYYESDISIQKLSTLVSNNFGIAVVEMPVLTDDVDLNKISVVLDGVRDPGNLGTIIRICDWYGIRHLIMSKDCTEYYNPKVISASMGSFSRIKHLYVDLEMYLKSFPDKLKIGALLNGENIHEFEFPDSGFIIFGNESNGISDSILKLINKPVTIPRFGDAESLNVGISCAVFLDNLVRR